LLKKWKIINNNQVERISELFKVRNELAHRWNEYELSYGKDESGNRLSITQNIEKFKVEAEKIWVELIEIFMKEEEKGKGVLISKIEDPNTINIGKRYLKLLMKERNPKTQSTDLPISEFQFERTTF
jgi:hypothetical protein